MIGGAWAKGLSENVCQAYDWIVDHYDEGDEIFIFGFSRGAYTARSLAGLIAICGLLKPGGPLGVNQLYDNALAEIHARHGADSVVFEVSGIATFASYSDNFARTACNTLSQCPYRCHWHAGPKR